jgi:hypothetical protein
MPESKAGDTWAKPATLALHAACAERLETARRFGICGEKAWSLKGSDATRWEISHFL